MTLARPPPRATRPVWLPRSMGGAGDAEAWRRIAPRIAESQVYVCGPREWAEAVCKAAARAGVGADRLRTEQFAW